MTVTRSHGGTPARDDASGSPSSGGLRAGCRAWAKRALDEGAHESALRWISLALGSIKEYSDDERGGATGMNDARGATRGGSTSEAWMMDAIDHELLGDALLGKGDVKAAVRAYATSAELAGRSTVSAASRAKMGWVSEDLAAFDVHEVKMKAARGLCRLGGEDELSLAENFLESVPLERRTLEHRLLSASIHRACGRERAAVMAYKDVIKEWPFAIEAAVALAELGVKAVDVRHAIQKAASPKDAECATFNLLEAYVTALGSVESGDVITAQNTLGQIKQAFPSDPYMTSAKARVDSIDNRNVQSALREYAAIRAKSPHFVEGMDEYALLLHEQGNKGALEALSCEMLELSPDACETWIVTALYYDITDMHVDGCLAAEKAIRINGQSANAHFVLGSMCLRNRRLRTAIKEFNLCITIKVSMKAYQGLVKAHLMFGSHANAMMVAKQAHKRSPQDAVAWSLIGDVHAKKETEYDKAIKAYEQALAYNPRLFRAVKSLATLNIKIGKIHVARAILQRQLDDYQPTDEEELVQLYCRLAQTLMLSRQTAESVKYYTRALAIRPTCQVAQDALEKFEQTRNPEYAAAMSDDEHGTVDEEMEFSRESGDWMQDAPR